MKKLLLVMLIAVSIGCGNSPEVFPTASVGSGTPYQVLESIQLDPASHGSIDTSKGLAQYVFVDATWVGAFQATVNQDPGPYNGYLIEIAGDYIESNNGVFPIEAFGWGGGKDGVWVTAPQPARQRMEVIDCDLRRIRPAELFQSVTHCTISSKSGSSVPRG